jgi:glutaredoxin
MSEKKPQRKQKRVALFTAPGCIWCTRAKQFFKRNNIRFNEIDVSRDKKAAADCKKHTGSGGVPVILIENKWISGFNEPVIKRELGIK